MNNGNKMLSYISLASILYHNDLLGYTKSNPQYFELMRAINHFLKVITEKIIKYDSKLIAADIMSTFGDNIEARKSHIVIDTGFEMAIDQDLYKKIAETINSKLQHDLCKIQFGHLLKTLNKNMTVSIVTGSHTKDLKLIWIDYYSHNVLSAEVLLLRIIHEILHDFGFSESYVVKNEKNVYNAIVKDSIKFAIKVKNELQSNLSRFVNNMELLFNDNLNLIFDIEKVFNRLTLLGMPPYYCNDLNVKTVDPITGESIEVPFMKV